MYVMSYFRTEAEALHLAVSDDGLRWQPLQGNRPVWHSGVGARSVRDPSLFRDPDGRFHLFSTNGWTSETIMHAVSDDLIAWSGEELIPVMAGVPGVRNAWAPECFFDKDEGQYRIIWSSSTTMPNNEDDHNHRIWGTTTRDFRTFTPAVLFFDPDHSVIDACVVPDGDRWLMAFKDERGRNEPDTPNKAIRVCFAPRASGPWSEASELLTPTLSEGPALFRRDGGWTMFYDHFGQGRFGAAFSRDGLDWEDITDRVTFPPGPRHVSVLEVDDKIGRRLAAAYDV